METETKFVAANGYFFLISDKVFVCYIGDDDKWYAAEVPSSQCITKRGLDVNLAILASQEYPQQKVDEDLVLKNPELELIFGISPDFTPKSIPPVLFRNFGEYVLAENREHQCFGIISPNGDFQKLRTSITPTSNQQRLIDEYCESLKR